MNFRLKTLAGLCLLLLASGWAQESNDDQVPVVFKTDPPGAQIFKSSGEKVFEIGRGGEKLVLSRQSDFGNGSKKVELVFKAPDHGTWTETLDLASVENLRETEGYFPREIELEPRSLWASLRSVGRKYPAGFLVLLGVALLALTGLREVWKTAGVRRRHRDLGGDGKIRKFAGFIFLNVLGEGATSKVWRCCRARDFFSFGKRPEVFVFKEISTNFQSDTQGRSEFAARFRREVEALEKCQHPNIVGLVDAGIEEETQRAYIVMEEAKGEPLKARLDRKEKLSLVALLSIAKQLCSALQHMHDLELIHREIKPANIIVTDQNQVCLVDLGIAKSTEEVEFLTKGGVVIGTPFYLPKWLLGFDKADKGWDQLATAVVLTELIGGVELVEHLKSKGGQNGNGAFPLPFEVRIRISEEAIKVLGKVVGSWDSHCLFLSMNDFFRAFEEAARHKAISS